MKDTCLNTGFVYHRARISWVSLDVTLNRTGARKIGAIIPVVIHSGSRRRRVSGGRFPIGNLLSLVVDRSRLSSKFVGWTGTAITSPLLGKRTDVYNWLHAVEFFLRHQSSSILSRHSLSFMTDEYSNMLFTAANHRSLCRAGKMQSTTLTQKSCWGNEYVKWG